ncbi:MAG: hypothetical protein R3D67_16780 [Hyphomicrobiaceae bacterium]
MDAIMLAFLIGGLGGGFLDGRRGEWWLGIVVAALTALVIWRLNVGMARGMPVDAGTLPILAVLGPLVYIAARLIGAWGRPKR